MTRATPMDLQVPLGWQRQPAWMALTPVKRTGHVTEDVLSVYREHGVIPKSSRSDNHNRTPEDLNAYQLVEPGDVVFNKMKAWSGSVGVSEHRGIVSGDYLVCRTDSSLVDRRFLHYLLRSRPFFEEYARRSTGIRPSQWRLYWEELSQLDLPLPTLETQRRIAAYLDVEMARADRLTAVNRRGADLAWEHFRRVRRDLVCDGMALGSAEVTSILRARGWQVLPLWMAARNHDTVRIPLNAEERGLRPGPYPYWGANSVQDHIDGWLFDGEFVLIAEDGGPFFIEARDVAWVVDGKFWVNNHAHILESARTPSAWLAAALNCVDYSLYVGGATRDKLTQTDLNSIPVPIPPDEYIAEALTAMRSAEERATSAQTVADRMRDLVEERKQALITAAVTGEITV